MTNRARSIGTDWEVRVAELYREVLGTPVWRLALHGAQDLGDLTGVYLTTVEAKAQQRWNVLAWLREARIEATHKGDPFYVVAAKRPRIATRDCPAVTTLGNHARLITRLRDSEAALQAADPATYRAHVEAHAIDVS